MKNVKNLKSKLSFRKQNKKPIVNSDNDDDDDDYESEYARIQDEKYKRFQLLSPPRLPAPAIPISSESEQQTFNIIQNDITMPIVRNFQTIFDLMSYKCELINDKTKRLDRNALNELQKLFSIDTITSNNLSFNLAKCITYEDIQLLRYNYDFGLGIFNGLELICLLHGNFIRLDVIDRHKTFKLFICLLITLCQLNSELRVHLLIVWIDCAYYLFEKLKNLFAFNYVMEALNHEQVSVKFTLSFNLSKKEKNKLISFRLNV